MKKLTIEQLAPYLPYGLKVLEEFDVNDPQIREVTGISNSTITTNLQRYPFRQVCNIDDIKPILRPLSDLTDEYLSELNLDVADEIELREVKDGKMLTGYLPHLLHELLISKHFDLFDLINSGLAIDINTLSK